MTVTRHFTLPEHQRLIVAKTIADWQASLMFTLTEKLDDMGIRVDLAMNLEMHALITWAARVGIIAAKDVMEREPNREWWLEACAEDFDIALKWHAEKFPNGIPKEDLP